MLLSLFDAIHQVGGNPQQILTEDLTVDKLIEILAPNGIRFVVKKRP